MIPTPLVNPPAHERGYQEEQDGGRAGHGDERRLELAHLRLVVVGVVLVHGLAADGHAVVVRGRARGRVVALAHHVELLDQGVDELVLVQRTRARAGPRPERRVGEVAPAVAA